MRATLTGAVLTLTIALALPASARADDPFVPWSGLLPSLAAGHEPSSADECRAGRTSCVDRVIRVMTQHLNALADACEHDAIFALAYLRTTEEYRRTIRDPRFFDDTAFMNHWDAVFAGYYFRAFQDYRGQRPVPPAWQIAFQAARDRALPASGNLSLGMNAHINRDLPFVLESIGLRAPDGSSRKPDHEKVNRFLNRVAERLIPEIARRFDPAIDDGRLPRDVDRVVTFQIVPSWREAAWRNAERLVNARTPAARAQVAAEIEAAAAAKADALRRSSAYGPLQSSAARDAHCRANG